MPRWMVMLTNDAVEAATARDAVEAVASQLGYEMGHEVVAIRIGTDEVEWEWFRIGAERVEVPSS